MSSGPKSIVINTAERAVSTDINRLQALEAKAMMEGERFARNIGRGSDDVQAGGVLSENTVINSPLSAEIIAGLCVLPAVGSLTLNVQDGLAYCVYPDASPSGDDSPYKYVQDEGGFPPAAAGGGPLAMSPNSSGQIRIDVIECQPIPDPTPETDNRDIFNPVTGLYTATAVTKSQGIVMQYRVRQGNPGSGYPGNAGGWLPLCVASVPTGTALNDSITFWDVRPLVSDRISSDTNVTVAIPRRTKLDYSANTGNASSPTICKVAGFAEVEYGNQRAGGNLLRGSPGVDNGQPYVDFSDTANQENGFAFTSTSTVIAFLYYVFPFGLPRWARYTDAASSIRAPRSPRGIPLLSNVAPYHVTGLPSAGIQFPAIFGFGTGGTFTAVCFGAMMGNSSSGGRYWEFVTAGKRTVLQHNSGLHSGSAAGSGTVTLTENVDFPAGCSSIRIQINLPITISGASDGYGAVSTTIKMAITGNENLDVSNVQTDTVPLFVSSVGGVFTVVSNVEIPLPTNYPTTTGTAQTYTLTYNSITLPSGCTYSSPAILVTGWTMQ